MISNLTSGIVPSGVSNLNSDLLVDSFAE